MRLLIGLLGALLLLAPIPASPVPIAWGAIYPGCQATTDVFTSGTGAVETVHPGCTQLILKVWGGGGAGRCAASGFGGGGGSQAIKTIAITTGNTFTITVAPAVAGVTCNASGTNGNTSTASGTLAGGAISLSAGGGAGGLLGSGTGGTATGGDTNTSGGNGASVGIGGSGANGGAGGTLDGNPPGGGGGWQSSSPSGGGARGEIDASYS